MEKKRSEIMFARYTAKYPCKDCDHRKLGCHDTCPDYQEQKKKHDELAEMIRNDPMREIAEYIHVRKGKGKHKDGQV